MRNFMLAISGFVLTLWTSSARTQCASTLQASCQGQPNIAIFLANDISSREQLTITCPDPGSGSTFSGWSLSPDGVTSVKIDISSESSKYVVNGLTLIITNITSADEGLYSCIYNQVEMSEQCVFVYARAVFASCPLDFAECSGDPTPLSVEEGKNITFNATIIHVGGGSCGFQQEIDYVRLKKINPQFGIDDELLLSCAIDDSSPTPCRNSRVSLSRGNDPGGFEFVFTLVDAVADMNISLYEVIVDVTDPVTSSISSLSKIFRLEVEKSQVSSEGPQNEDTTEKSQLPSDRPQDEDTTSHSMPILKTNSAITTLMSCAIALLFLMMFASRSTYILNNIIGHSYKIE